MELDVQRPVGESRPRGPVAILTSDPAVYALACTYAALGRSTMTIEVFRDWTEADAWRPTRELFFPAWRFKTLFCLEK